MSEKLKSMVAFFATPYGIILILVWLFGSIWSAYRRLGNKGKKTR